MTNPIIRQTGRDDGDLNQLIYEMLRSLIDTAGAASTDFTVNIVNKSGTLAGPDE